MNAYLVFGLLVGISTTLFLLSMGERQLCEVAADANWWLCRKFKIAVEQLYYLRDATGMMMYVGQSVDHERRWSQHIADGRKTGTRKADWACLVDRPHCTVVRYCWTHEQVMRIERRRTLAIYYCFAAWNFLQVGEPVQLTNTSNTPYDERQPPRLLETLVAVCFAPFYLLESWMLPEAQWHVPVDKEDLQ